MSVDNWRAELSYVEAALRRWDPIGVYSGNFESPPVGEYDAYAPSVVSLLARGRGVDDLARHLSQLRTKQMGLPTSADSDLALARELVERWRAVER